MSWQIVPVLMDEVLRDPDVDKAQRAMKSVLGMGKNDIAVVAVRSVASSEPGFG